MGGLYLHSSGLPNSQKSPRSWHRSISAVVTSVLPLVVGIALGVSLSQLSWLQDPAGTQMAGPEPASRPQIRPARRTGAINAPAEELMAGDRSLQATARTTSGPREPGTNHASPMGPAATSASAFSKQYIMEMAAGAWLYETPFYDPAGTSQAGQQLLREDYLNWNDNEQADLWNDLSSYVTEKAHSCPCSMDLMFPRIDALVLWGMVRLLKPRRIVEVGSGVSTKVAGFALLQNMKESGKFDGTEHICIEPYRSAVLDELHFNGLRVIPVPVQNVNATDVFGRLQAGDFLFLDNSHVIRPYGDVVFELLHVLTTLPPGVIVHLHDIFLPYDYPRSWMLEEFRVYTEQWLVAALLRGNPEWKILWGGHRNLRRHATWFAAAFPPLPGLEHIDGLASSFWIEKQPKLS